jgi:lipopolysaccharide transport system ATP-binding protein
MIMGNIAVSVENLGKRYRIGLSEKRSDNLREAIRSFVGTPFHYLRTRLREPEPEELIWALKDVSFEVKHGEVLGIIGKNGAGKSTLLKILSRITEPTEGYAKVYGRVGSLLEVGTGFHPELTGRENIYLNGAILGMRRTEIDRRFDEIIDFSGVEKFIDTPVKRYSSGMYVRLAFAVAAHLEPAILIVDEVLAVGDIEFQQKCLGKMKDTSIQEGRTVLFVSHNMMAIEKLCKKAIFLFQGQVKAWGDVDEIVAMYEHTVLQSQDELTQRFPIVNHHYGLALEDVQATVIQENNHAHLQLKVSLTSSEQISQIGFRVIVHTLGGLLIAKLGAALTNNIIEEVKGSYVCILEGKNIEQYLTSGKYSISIDLVFPRIEPLISAENVAIFKVPALDIYDSGVPCESIRHGIVPLQIKLIQVHVLN